MNWLQNLLFDVPILLIGVGLVAAMFAFSRVGLWIRKRQPTPPASDKDTDGQEGYIVSAVLGLLALLLGFTFSMAVDRFEGRRALVLEEANAIGTAYLRAQLLPEPHRTRMSGILVNYVNNRVALAHAARGHNGDLLERNDALVTDIWTETKAAFPTIQNLDFSSTFVDSMNLVIDLDTSRKAARLARVPSEILVVLLVYVLASAAVLGYVLQDLRSRRAAGALLILLSMSLMLVVDINRPGQGAIVESQLPMELLQKSLKGWPPQVFDRWSGPAAPASAAPQDRP